MLVETKTPTLVLTAGRALGKFFTDSSIISSISGMEDLISGVLFISSTLKFPSVSIFKIQINS